VEREHGAQVSEAGAHVHNCAGAAAGSESGDGGGEEGYLRRELGGSIFGSLRAILHTFS
jgi:hypothetical protein